MKGAFIKKNTQVNFGVSFFFSILIWMANYNMYGGYPWVGILLEYGLTPSGLAIWLFVNFMTWGIVALNFNWLIEYHQ